MKILSWYVVKDFLKNLAYVLAALVGLLVVANLFSNLDGIFSSWIVFAAFLEATLQSLPTAFEILLPFSVLIATVLTFTNFSRTSELVAMKSAGLGMRPLLYPILLALIPITLFSYFNQNYLYRMLNKDPVTTRRTFANQWKVDGRNIYYLGAVNPKTKGIQIGVLFQWSDSPFRISRLLDFRTGNRSGEQWALQDVMIQDKNEGVWKTTRSPSENISVQDFPNFLKSYEVDAHHMPFLDLYWAIRQLEKRDAKVVVYLLEWYQKTAVLFAPLIMVLVGAPLSQFHIRKGRVAAELIITILAGVVFWIGNEIVLIFGKSGALPPYLAAWAANLVFLMIGVALLRRVR